MSVPAREGPLKRLWRRSSAERAMLVEAAMLLVAISLGVRLLPFRRMALLARLPVQRRRSGEPLRSIMHVAWAVRAAARRVGVRAVCIEQGLAAHVMLRRRGIDTTLFYGIANDAGGLRAHVWVRWGEIDVIGCELASGFTRVACFPERGEAARRSPDSTGATRR